MNSRHPITTSLVCLFACGMFFFCCKKQENGWGGSIEQQNGVTIVKNHRDPIYTEEVLSLKKDLVIGQAEGTNEYLFSRIGGIDVDGEGNIHVIDEAEAHVRVFDADGRYVRMIGRKGQGPGEMERPVFVQITAQDEVVVYDISTFRAIFFSQDGDFLRQRATRRPILPLCLDSQGYLIGIESLAPPPVGGKILKKYDPDFKEFKSIAQDEQGQRGVIDIGKPTIYGCVGPNDEVIWGNSDEYSLNVHNPRGEKVKVIQKNYSPVPITSEYKREQEEKYAEPVQYGMKLSFRSHFPAFSGIFVDEEGRIFVKTYEHEEGKVGFYFDVFDKEGRFAARVTVEANLNERSAWKDGKLYTIDMDESGFPQVLRYQLTWTK